MTRHIPEGNTLRHLESIVADLRHGVDVWPGDATERAADRMLRRTRARPEWPRPRPWWIAALFLVAAFLAGAGLAWIVADMIATGAVTATQAKEYAQW